MVCQITKDGFAFSNFTVKSGQREILSEQKSNLTEPGYGDSHEKSNLASSGP